MFLFFDTETTGLPVNWNAPVDDLKNWPRLVQIAWISYDNSGKKIREKESIVRPEGFIIPEESSKVHGITTEIALERGKKLDDIMQDFSSEINGSDFLVAHNMNFDEKIVGAEFIRSGISSKLFEIERICTMVSSIDFCRIPSNNKNGYKWPRLSELHIKLFGKDFEDAHDAFVDTQACARCFFELKKLGIIKIPESFGKINEKEKGMMQQGSLFY